MLKIGAITGNKCDILHAGKNNLKFSYRLSKFQMINDLENIVKMLLRLLTSNEDSSLKLFPIKTETS